MTTDNGYPMTDLEATVPADRAASMRWNLEAYGFTGWTEQDARGYWQSLSDGPQVVFRVLAPTWLENGRPALQSLAQAARKAAPGVGSIQVVQRPSALVLEA